jgi:hypothetical protein
MDEMVFCPQCSRPLKRVEAPPFMLHAELVIYRCQECVEETEFWGDVIETPKHWMLTASGELKDLPPDAPRAIG